MWQHTALILHTVLYYLHFLPIVFLTSKCHIWNFFSDMKVDYATSYPISQKLNLMDITHLNTRVIFSLHLFLTWLRCQPSWMHHLNYTKILYTYALRQKSWKLLPTSSANLLYLRLLQGSAITKSYGTLSKVTVQGTEIIQIVMYLFHATHCCIYLYTLPFPRSEFCLHYQQV